MELSAYRPLLRARPSVDSAGRPCIGLADGDLLIATPYGERAVKTSLGAPACVLFPLDLQPGGAERRPCLAAGLDDGRLLLVGADGGVMATYRAKAAPISVAWDGKCSMGWTPRARPSP